MKWNWTAAAALFIGHAGMTQTSREPAVIAPGHAAGSSSLEANATGVFINEHDVLTARHVVAGCGSLFVLKDGQVARAQVRATSEAGDLAVLTSTLRPLLVASFARTVDLGRAQPVFAASYEVLRHMPDRGQTIYNGLATTGTGTAASELTLTSAAVAGASGSAVLDARGRVIGLVSGRAQVDGNDPRAYATRSGAASYVVAISSATIRAFLASRGVPYTETDAPQLEPMQPHAPRAATLEVGVLCGE